MAIVDALLPEYDHETDTTRKLLDRVPDGNFAWKPHDKSMSLGELAGHVATLLNWGQTIVNQSDFDLAAPFARPPLDTRAELLAAFDTEREATRAALAGATDAQLMAPWSLKRGKDTMFTMPKVAVLRSFMLNHLIHHRGQLSVYLRLNNVPLPSIYGPSADERI
ncbi:MAG: DinB family protein [Vicinamibacterales bacterium]